MIEKIVQFSVTNRILIVLLTVVVACYGGYLLKSIPIDAVPDVTNQQVQINTSIENLSPTEIEKQVTFPIENVLSGIPGLEETRSISRNGFSQVTAIFEDRVKISYARQQIAERLNEIREQLPEGAEPKMGPMSTGLGEVYMWTVDYENGEALRSAKKNASLSLGWQPDGTFLTPEGLRLRTPLERMAYLRTVQDWMIKPQLKGISGLAGVDAIGGDVMQIHIQPDPKKMVMFGISLKDLMDALEDNNKSIGAGYIEVNGEAFLVKTDARFENIKEMEDLVVKSHKGIPVYLHDIATVAIDREMRTGSSSRDGHEAVTGTALMLVGGNSRVVARAVDEKLEEIRKTLPPGIRVTTAIDRTTLIDSTIHTVVSNLAEGALLVVLVLFLLLGNFRAALITALVIPFSMLIMAIGMVQSKISGNLMSLGAIDFGLIVDGAVIITENALRRLTEKQHLYGRLLNLQERLHEVFTASKEMIRPSVFGQMIIIIVYVPLLMLSGIEGKMFEPMAITVIFALLAAFVLSLTFVPAMIALFVKVPMVEKKNIVIEGLRKIYVPSLRWVLNRPYAVLFSAAVFIGVGALLFSSLGQEFVPTLDEHHMALQVTRTPSTSISQATAMQIDVEKALQTFPEVDAVFSKTGTAEVATDPMPPDASDTFIILKPRSQWPDPSLDKLALIEKMETVLHTLPGNQYEFTQPIEMRFNELIAGIQSDVAVKIYGDDFQTLQQTGDKVAAALRTVPGAADVVVDKLEGLPVLQIDINREAVSRYGVQMRDVLETIRIAMGGGKAGVFYSGDRRLDIVVRMKERLREDREALQNLPIPLSSSSEQNAQFIPLQEIAAIQLKEGWNEIGRENGKRVLIVQANVRGSDLGTFIHNAKHTLQQKVHIPAGYWIAWGGQYESLLSARDRLMIVVPVCFFLIFIALYAAFKSVKDAFAVFSGVPLALTGGILALWFRDMPFSISAAVGFIALSGIAVLNGIVLVSSIKQLGEQGAEDPITEGSMMRLRPVFMTALVASLGFLPMAMATGAGAEVQKPLATVVVGGLCTSTLLTLGVLPALYAVLSGQKRGVHPKRKDFVVTASD